MSMMICEPKPQDELAQKLAPFKRIFMVGCNGCAEVFGAGGTEGLKGFGLTFKSMGKSISGQYLLEMVCERSHNEIWFSRKAQELKDSEAVVVLACGIGVQVIASIVEKPVYPALNTLSLGGRVGLSWGNEGCQECGDCLLGETAGICPMKACAKRLLNGPCGGGSEGSCEVYPEQVCGWVAIYQRLKKYNRLELMRKTTDPRRFSKSAPSAELRQVSQFLARGGESES